jgi:DNA-binding XRE family transcriptional regulator
MPNDVSVNSDDLEAWTDLGTAIRERRVGRGLTLVGLAGRVNLSQPFLSQIENGRARPSLMSLHRIAEALETTPQALFGGAAGNDVGPVVVRADDARVVGVNGDADNPNSHSICCLLIASDAAVPHARVRWATKGLPGLLRARGLRGHLRGQAVGSRSTSTARSPNSGQVIRSGTHRACPIGCGRSASDERTFAGRNQSRTDPGQSRGRTRCGCRDAGATQSAVHDIIQLEVTSS